VVANAWIAAITMPPIPFLGGIRGGSVLLPCLIAATVALWPCKTRDAQARPRFKIAKPSRSKVAGRAGWRAWILAWILDRQLAAGADGQSDVLLLTDVVEPGEEDGSR
jgi:hypothetical protein